MGLVIDSSVLIAAERQRLTVVELIGVIARRYRNPEIALSTMTAAELLHGLHRAGKPAIRARREQYIEEVLARIPCYSFTLEIARIFGEIDAVTRSKGNVVATADLVIGCTALGLRFAVLTANLRHFRLIPK